MNTLLEPLLVLLNRSHPFETKVVRELPKQPFVHGSNHSCCEFCDHGLLEFLVERVNEAGYRNGLIKRVFSGKGAPLTDLRMDRQRLTPSKKLAEPTLARLCAWPAEPWPGSDPNSADSTELRRGFLKIGHCY